MVNRIPFWNYQNSWPTDHIWCVQWFDLDNDLCGGTYERKTHQKPLHIWCTNLVINIAAYSYKTTLFLSEMRGSSDFRRQLCVSLMMWAKVHSTSAQSNFNLSLCVTFQATPCYEADGWTLARTPGASHFNNQLLSIPLSAVVHYNKESRTYEAVENLIQPWWWLVKYVVRKLRRANFWRLGLPGRISHDIVSSTCQHALKMHRYVWCWSLICNIKLTLCCKPSIINIWAACWKFWFHVNYEWKEASTYRFSWHVFP